MTTCAWSTAGGTPTQPDNDRFDEIYTTCAEDVRRHIRRIVRDPEAAEDVLQETFIRAWNKRETWNEIRDFGHWLIRIGTNLALNHLRSKNRSRVLPIGATDDGDDENRTIERLYRQSGQPGYPDPEVELAKKSECDLVRRLISELPEDKRIVMELVGQEDLSIREASDLLDIPGGTVKSRLYYGRKRLADRLKELFDMEE